MKITHPKVLVASILIIFLVGFTTAFNFGVEFENNGTGNVYNYYNITNGTSYWTKTGNEISYNTGNIHMGSIPLNTYTTIDGNLNFVGSTIGNYFTLIDNSYMFKHNKYIELNKLKLNETSNTAILDYNNITFYGNTTAKDFCITNGNCLSTISQNLNGYVQGDGTFLTDSITFWKNSTNIIATSRFKFDASTNTMQVDNIKLISQILGNSNTILTHNSSSNMIETREINPQVWGSNLGYWNKTGDDIYYNNGFVGINNGNPTTALDINGDITLNGNLNIINSSNSFNQ